MTGVDSARSRGADLSKFTPGALARASQTYCTRWASNRPDGEMRNNRVVGPEQFLYLLDRGKHLESPVLDLVVKLLKNGTLHHLGFLLVGELPPSLLS